MGLGIWILLNNFNSILTMAYTFNYYAVIQIDCRHLKGNPKIQISTTRIPTGYNDFVKIKNR